MQILRYSLVVMLFAVLFGYCWYQVNDLQHVALREVQWQAEWIRYPGGNVPRSYFRKEFFLSQAVTNAWLQVSADNDYSLYVNGSFIGREANLSSNTSSYQYDSTQLYQKIGNEVAFPSKNPPEAQWNSNPDWQAATFYDVAPILKQGRNIIALFLQSDKDSPRLLLEGEILDVNQETTQIKSDASWQVNDLESYAKQIAWYHLEFTKAANWPHAESLGKPQENIYTALDPNIFKLPLRGEFVYYPSPLGSESFLHKQIYVESSIQDAWLRIASQGPYALFINGNMVNSGSARDHIDIIRIDSLLHSGCNVISVQAQNPYATDSTFLPRAMPAGFLLDGRILHADGTVQELVTDETWQAAAYPEQEWLQCNQGIWMQAASQGALAPDFSRNLPKKYLGPVRSDWQDFGRVSFYIVAAFFAVFSFWLLLAHWMSMRWQIPFANAAKNMLLCLWPGIFLLVAMISLDSVLAESAQKIWFQSHEPWSITLLLSVILLFASGIYLINRNGIAAGPLGSARGPRSDTAVGFGSSFVEPNCELAAAPTDPNGPAKFCYRNDPASFHPDPNGPAKWRYAIALLLITAVGAFLRLYELGVQPYHSDESSSLSAILGILDTGIPQYVSGIWYSRGPLYHYITALSMALLGNNAFAARLPSALFGIFTIPLIYFFVKQIFGNRNVALLAAVIYAISPWAVFSARTVRFYQQFQFFCVLTIFYFVKGFVLNFNKRDQNYAFLWFNATFLSQEVGVTLLPALGLAYWLYTPWHGWRQHINIYIGCFITGGIIVADALVFLWKCLTPFVGITATCSSVMQLHLSDVWSFSLNLFVGYNRFHLILSLFFFLGFLLFWRRRNKAAGFLYLLVLVTLATVTIVVMQVGLRYVYDLYPFFIILGALAVFELVNEFKHWYQNAQTSLRMQRVLGLTRSLGVGLAVVCIVLAYQPQRIYASYDVMINRGDTIAHQFVAENMRPTDKVMAGHHPGAFANAVGHCDYYLLQRSLFDEIFKKDGVMIDRRGGATIVDTIEKLREVFENNDRVWIVISDLRMASLQKDLILFLQNNTQIVYQPFLCTVFLWDAQRGKFHTPRYRQQPLFYF